MTARLSAAGGLACFDSADTRADRDAAKLGFEVKLATFTAMKVIAICLALWCALASTLSQARAGEALTLVVNHGKDTATYYLSMPSEGIKPILGSNPDLLFSDAGRVPIEAFRQTGSFDLADEMFANISGGVGGRRFAFESMSMMVHPKSQPLPFAAPWDAYTAISVCSVDNAKDQLVPGELQIYHGGFTDQVTGDAPLSLYFPKTGRAALDIVVHHYENGRLVGTYVETLADGGTLTIGVGQRLGLASLAKASMMWIVLIGVGLGALVLIRSRFRDEPPPAST